MSGSKGGRREGPGASGAHSMEDGWCHRPGLNTQAAART